MRCKFQSIRENKYTKTIKITWKSFKTSCWGSTSFWFNRSELAPGICISNKYSGDDDIVVPGTTTENDNTTLRNNYLFRHGPQWSIICLPLLEYFTHRIYKIWISYWKCCYFQRGSVAQKMSSFITVIYLDGCKLQSLPKFWFSS